MSNKTCRFNLFLIIMVLPFFCIAQTNIIKDFDIRFFRAFPDSITNKKIDYLIKKIIPNNSYVYWQCMYLKSPYGFYTENNNGELNEKAKLVNFYGDTLKYKSIADKYMSWDFIGVNNPEGSIGKYGYYFVALMDSNHVKVFDKNNIDKFIGTIDNLNEVALRVNLKGRQLDNDMIVNGAYRETNTAYLLYVKTGFIPENWILKKTGEFEFVDELKFNKNDSINYNRLIQR